MRKFLFLFVFLLVSLSWAGSALAVTTTIDYAFTADNKASTNPISGVTGFSLVASGGTPQNIISKTDGWQNYLFGSFEFDYTPGQTYSLQWLVQNDGGVPTSSNPMAFLGVFSVFGHQYVSSAASPWQVEGVAPTSLGLLSGDNVWNKNGNDKLEGYFINTLKVDPYWLGFTSGTLQSMKVTASFVAPVPIPGAALLLGSAILGLVGIRRRQLV